MAGFLEVARTQLQVYGARPPTAEGPPTVALGYRLEEDDAQVARLDSARLARKLRARQRSSLDVLLSKLSTTHLRGQHEDSIEEMLEDSAEESINVSEPMTDASDMEIVKSSWNVTWVIEGFCPMLSWLKAVNASTLKADVFAGLTVWAMTIPQSLSFAKLAGLPFAYGLYSASVPAFVYAVFGQSRQLAVGPVAMTSLILRAGLLGALDEKHCPSWYDDNSHTYEVYQNDLCTRQYCVMMFSVAGLVGVIMLVAWFFKLGFLVSFLGHPVISGFTSGAALIIGLSQWKYFLGFGLPSTEHVHELLFAVAKGIHKSRPAPLLLGLLWLGFLVGTRHLAKRDPRYRFLALIAPLLSCGVGALLMWMFPELKHEYGVQWVGHVPAGLAPVTAGDLWMTWELFEKIKITAIFVALISYMESIAIAKALASQHNYEINPGQELLALGLTNLVGAAFSCYAVTGSFSRTAVANSSGAQTQVAGIMTALGMIVVLLFLTPALRYLPMFALAAISTNSVISLIAYDVAIDLWRVKRWDFVLWFVAFLGTIFIDAIKGIIIAIALSTGVVIYESIRPQLNILWRVPGTKLYRSIDQETQGQFIPHVLIVQLGSSLYFANVGYVKEVLLQYIEEVSAVSEVEHLVLEMASVLTVDATAAHLIQDVVGDCRERGIETAFAMVGKRAMKTLTKAGLVDFVGRDMFFPTVDEAVHEIRSELCTRQLHRAMTVGLAPDEEADITLATVEVGISNDMHPRCTQVCIAVPHAVDGLVNAIGAVFMSSGCSVLSARVDATSHTYRVVKEERKLCVKDIEALRSWLRVLLQSLFPAQRQGIVSLSAHSADLLKSSVDWGSTDTVCQESTGGAGRACLERAIEAERAKVAEGELAKHRIESLEAALVQLGAATPSLAHSSWSMARNGASFGSQALRAP
mmetsp:Transcript_84540/g.244370  ORF Transcript_84540/g.244370 Transcript_84540/m.244370 type:complete len:920 (-) Transcript_84540:192-2951(-)|eukprot:CAMPEP_0176174902 /NCGR_PEP_ID=MMETSP0120_2-20121206/89604_1 /TAXON_ID=160619 /ORGANISM="Kryptoperidinium foliaceum, Strain CCMP 1326" /LENGTH=919 /DNA_ID=CAMNT_0017512941 /DNA_START=54 /DNA_END=2813 /DNA_ORIENTATION=-